MPTVRSEQSSIEADEFLVRVERLSKTYSAGNPFGRPDEQTVAIRDVSFDVAPGETLGLVGASGSGKTTIARIMLRLVEPTSGHVLVNVPSRDCVNLIELGAEQIRRVRRHVQIVFPDPYTSLNPRLTVREIIEEPLRVREVVAGADVSDRATQLLEQVGLNRSILGDHPERLSGGQRQRVGIARAIATEPCFVVADEPVTALDVSVQAQILNLFKDLPDALGLSYLFISHDLAVVEQMSDRIAVLSDGQIVEIGESGVVLDEPAHPVTQKLVNRVRARANSHHTEPN